MMSRIARIAPLLPALLAGVLSGATPSRAAGTDTGIPATKDAASVPVTAAAAEPAKPATGAVAIPGTTGTLKVSGYVKVDFIQDFDGIGDASEFKAITIPVDGSAGADQGGRTTLQARESRLNLDYHSGTGIRAFVEGDFYGDKNAFRLRHAYGETGGLLGGQTWTTFMDISARPLTVDFEGAEGEVFLRQAQIRWTQKLSEHWRASFSVEHPSPEFAVPGTLQGSVRSDMPDFVAMARGTGSPGHVQVAGLVRQIRFDGQGGDADQRELGWGLNGALGIKTLGKDELLAQLAYGEGIAHYIEGLSGTASDAAFDAADQLHTLTAMSFLVGYTRHWTETLRSGLAYSMAEVDSDPAQGGGALEEIQDFRANLIHTFAKHVELCGEMLWGRRVDQNGAAGDAVRAQFAIIYHIN